MSVTPISDDDRKLLAVYGIHPAVDVDVYRQAGIETPAEMVHLFTVGINSIGARYFARAGLRGNSEAMAAAHKAGVTGIEAYSYHEVGITDLETWIHLTSNGVRGGEAKNLCEVGICSIEEMKQFVEASRKNGVRPYEIEALYKRLGELGELGTRLKKIHVAPRTTEYVLRRDRGLRAELDKLTDDNLRCVVQLAEDGPKITAEEMRGLIDAMT